MKREYEVHFTRRVVTEYHDTYRVTARDEEEAAELASDPEAVLHSTFITDRQTTYPSYRVEPC